MVKILNAKARGSFPKIKKKKKKETSTEVMRVIEVD